MSATDAAPTPPPIPRSSLLSLRANLNWVERQVQAAADMRGAAKLWRLALTLGWYDIRLRYRGSVLGPFWLTLSTAVMVVALGILYSTLFRMELHDYLPYLAISLVLWTAISTIVGEACIVFTMAEGTVRSMRMPYSLHAARVVVRNLLVLAHNAVVIVAVYAWFNVWPGWAAIEALPGVALWVVDSVACCLLFGALCARFRDIPPIIASLMQIAFFVSPIIWKPELLTGRSRELLPLNPFYTLLDVVRGPLLGERPSTIVWISAGSFSLLLLLAAWFTFVRVRGRLAFWV